MLTLRDLVTAYGKEGTSEERLAAMESVIGDRAAKILQDCEEHLAHMGNNYQPFLWPFYKGHRAQLFRLLSDEKPAPLQREAAARATNQKNFNLRREASPLATGA